MKVLTIPYCMDSETLVRDVYLEGQCHFEDDFTIFVTSNGIVHGVVTKSELRKLRE